MRGAVLIFFFLVVRHSFAQENDIPLGTWRLHLNYSKIKSLAEAGEHVYGAADFGLMYVDFQERSTGSITKLNGLSGIGVNYIANDEQKKILIIGYQDGTIDFLEKEKIVNLQTLKTTVGISGSRAINHLSVTGKTVYASTDFGVVVLDIEKKEIRETWRDLGITGKTIRIHQSTILKDSIFLATEKGVWCGSLKANLLDYNNWKKYNSGEFGNGVKTIATFNNSIYTSVDGIGIFRKQGNSWIKEAFLQNKNYSKLKGTESRLFVCSGAALWQVDTQNQLTEIKSTALTQANDVLEKEGSLYIADNSNGILFRGKDNEVLSFITSGPRLNSFWDIRYDQNSVHAIGGGYTEGLLPINNPGHVSSFSNGWSSSMLSVTDITDFDLSNPSQTFYSSFKNGLLEIKSQQELKFDNTNSPLENNSITAIEKTADGLWVANYNANKPLHLLKGDGLWESFSFTFSPAKFPMDLIQDTENNLWMVVSPKDGGGLVVFNRQLNKSVYLNDQGNQGGLPSKRVHSIATDRTGRVWVGTRSEEHTSELQSPSIISYAVFCL